ncbi:MAG: UDP-N-acetylglucosamine 2-epimerase [Bryobacteraceae bacterium]|jgi:UDP-hydrolysing UDP-N-acetyl-D-glucosamine 2-epimerase
MPLRKICVVLVDRANYGRLKPVMMAIRDHPSLELQCIAAGTMVLERFGRPVDLVKSHGLPVAGEIYTELEGSTPSSMAKSVGFATVEFASEFQRLKPDIVLLIGDRYEALAAALSAAYMNLCIVHIQGGEVSGSIDESARHAITKFAHFHFPATKRSQDYLQRMGEAPETILGVGCPSSDLARTLVRHLPEEVLNGTGSGARIDPDEPFLLTVFHPTTTTYGTEPEQMWQLLRALEREQMPTVLLWPNIDAGSDHISKAIRVFRDQTAPHWLRTITNLNPENYLRVLSQACCAVGNSSSFVRDAGFFGTPVVLVGGRQEGREIGEHVMAVRPREAEIVAAMQCQRQHGRYPPSTLYGDGYVAEKIADALARLTPYRQKRLHYIYDSKDANSGSMDASTRDSDGSWGVERDPSQKPGPARRKAAAGLHS